MTILSSLLIIFICAPFSLPSLEVISSPLAAKQCTCLYLRLGALPAHELSKEPRACNERHAALRLRTGAQVSSFLRRAVLSTRRGARRSGTVRFGAARPAHLGPTTAACERAATATASTVRATASTPQVSRAQKCENHYRCPQTSVRNSRSSQKSAVNISRPFSPPRRKQLNK